MGFDDRCFAAIINLGVNGHLKIDGSGKKPTLEHHKGGRAVAPEEEAMEGKLFSSGEAILLDQTNHVMLGSAKDALQETLSSEYLGKLFANNYGWSGLGFVLALLLAGAVVFAAVSTGRTELVGGADLRLPHSLCVHRGRRRHGVHRLAAHHRRHLDDHRRRGHLAAGGGHRVCSWSTRWFPERRISSRSPALFIAAGLAVSAFPG